MVKICVIALVGLPTSGKTTFCKAILNALTEFNFIHMCYDEMFSFLPESSKVAFKEERKKVMKKIEKIIDFIESNKCLGEELGYTNFTEQSSTNAFVIVCDDNNYYSGMRYEIYQMCKRHQLSYGQVYFPLSLHEALLRNSKRGDNALPSSVIDQMNKRLEKPSDKNQWEKNTLTIQNSFAFGELKSFLEMCFSNPIIRICRGEKLSGNKMNIAHEIDLLLRKRIKEALHEAEGQDLNVRANVLNQRRKKILLDLKKKEVSGTDLDVECVLERLLSV